MGYQTKGNFSADIESAASYSWIRAFGDTVKARLASSALAEWWSEWAFDPTKNHADFLAPVPPDVAFVGPGVVFTTPVAPQVQRDITVQASGSASLRLQPASTNIVHRLEVATPKFRVANGRSYTIKLRFRQDTAIGGILGFHADFYASNKITSAGSTSLGAPVGSSAGAWTTFSATFTPTTERWARLRFTYNSSVNPVYIDEITVTEATSVFITPIGSIVAWSLWTTGTPTTLPDGWLECNGQIINDAASPMNGNAVPNINVGAETGHFLRGTTGTGVFQTADIAAHLHGVGTLAVASGGGAHQHQIGNSGTAGSSHCAVAANDRTGTSPAGLGLTLGTGSFTGTHTHTLTGSTANSTGTETRPKAFSVRWIIRIK